MGRTFISLGVMGDRITNAWMPQNAGVNHRSPAKFQDMKGPGESLVETQLDLHASKLPAQLPCRDSESLQRR
ncbi:hypothetical protein C8T65DRAFT_653666, partial [Cerioporus squamosus]